MSCTFDYLAKLVSVQRTLVRLSHLRGLAGGQYIRIAAGILASPALARGLGPEGRGVWALILLYDLATTLLLGRGLPNAFGFSYLRWHEENDGPATSNRAFAYANWMLRRITIVSLVLGSILLIALIVLGRTNAMLVSFGLLTMTTPLATLQLCARQYGAVSRQDKWVLTLDAIPALVQAALFVALFVVDALSIASALGVLVGVRLLAAFLASKVWRRTTPERPTREFSRYGWRALPTALSQLAQGRIEQVAILSISTSAVGVFAVGGVIASLPVPLYRATGQHLFRAERLSPQVWVQAFQQTLLAWAVAVVASIAGLWLVPIIYGSAFEQAGVIALILTLGSLGEGCFILGRGWMDRSGHPGRSSTIALVHIALIVMIVPLVAAAYGLYPAALASAGLQWFRGAASLISRSNVGVAALPDQE